MAAPDLLKSNDAAEPLQGGGSEFNDDEGVEHPAGCCGPCAGVAEAFSLFWIVPGFWRLALYMFTSAAGGLLPAIYYLGPLSSQIWKDNATKISLLTNACQFSVAIVGAPLFGMWSDGRPRKISMFVSTFAAFLRFAPFMFLSGAPSLWASSVMTVITAPFVSQLSGSPVLWAWMTDTIPQEHRETGFSLIFSIGALAAWITGTLVSALANAFGWPPKTYMWIGIVLIVIALFLVITAPSTPIPERSEDPDPLSQQKGLKDMLISPFRLVARKRSLRLICGVAAFVTLPDVAVTYVAQPIVFVILNIDGADPANVILQAKLCNWFSNFPNILLIVVYAVVGVFAKRYGPARTLVYWTPLTCCFFAAPALFALSGPDNPPLEVFCGLMMTSPISIYPPLQALVALLVPPSRVGEAMGAVAACKNVASLCAPLIMGAVVEALGDHKELQWTLFPGAALFMLCGAWPFCILLNKRMGDGTETDVKWSVWSDASGSMARSAMNSRLGSRGGSVAATH